VNGERELLFGLLLLVVAAGPLRRGERWAWWCACLMILAFVAFAALFGAHDAGNLTTAVIFGALVALALAVLLPRSKAVENPQRAKSEAEAG
jgi:amino acid transporter